MYKYMGPDDGIPCYYLVNLYTREYISCWKSIGYVSDNFRACSEREVPFKQGLLQFLKLIKEDSKLSVSQFIADFISELGVESFKF